MKQDRTEIHSAIPLDADTAIAIEKLVRLTQAGAKHRLVCEFSLVHGHLGVLASLERKVFRNWTAVRSGTWIPLVPSTAGLIHILVYVAEHGRLPDVSDTPTQKKQ